jgi:hypothetical protein
VDDIAVAGPAGVAAAGAGVVAAAAAAAGGNGGGLPAIAGPPGQAAV